MRFPGFEVANLGLDRLELFGVGHASIQQATTLRLDLPLHGVDVALQTTLVPPQGVQGEAQLAQSCFRLSQDCPHPAKLVAALQFPMPGGEPIDREVELLEFEESVHPPKGPFGGERLPFRIHGVIASHTATARRVPSPGG